MTTTAPIDQATLGWLDTQARPMRELVERLSNVNSGTYNVAGVARVAAMTRDAIAPLGADVEQIAVDPVESIDATGIKATRPLGPALRARKRPHAPLQVLLSAHLDTVYAADHPFQRCEQVDPHTLRGPGVADIKGGIVVMLKALEALERSPAAQAIGWEVLLNPDEEIGSPGSRRLLAEAAGRHDVGLVFEPTLADGSMVSARKGSGNFTVLVRGRAAHAGREFHLGRNAVHAAAQVVVALSSLNHTRPDLTVNVGKIEGGGPVNIVPDLAIVRFNVRVGDAEDQRVVEQTLNRVIGDISSRDGLNATVHGGFSSPPKPIDEAGQRLISRVTECGHALGLRMHWKPTGGVCDGNKLAAAGLPNVDTMGVRGGGTHSEGEFLVLDCLVERARLTMAVLLSFAADPQNWKRRR